MKITDRVGYLQLTLEGQMNYGGKFNHVGREVRSITELIASV